ncbi:hypothetical protein [Sporomusa sphaeroides]|uniref:hypothetical protein n=1 Tax=Sporomusa sphaeroides TaxID=47679 RepID=UPI002C477E4C|nr:hypothetical protein [Sporomusa sphaeroides]HML33560.1 hypothetical protein [Sporomusa sphaeroides]
MELSNLTTRLNIKAIGIISVFMLFFIIYNHWISFQEKKDIYNRHMECFAHHLESVVPANLLVDYGDKPTAEIQSLENQILAVNNKVQPILDNTFVPLDIIKFGGVFQPIATNCGNWPGLRQNPAFEYRIQIV